MKSKPSPGIRPDTCQIINLKANCSKKKKWWPRDGRVPGKDKIKRSHLKEGDNAQNRRLRTMASLSPGRYNL